MDVTAIICVSFELGVGPDEILWKLDVLKRSPKISNHIVYYLEDKSQTS